MAFVFSEPRFASYQNTQTPGPGSHYPDIVQISKSDNSSSNLKRCLKKGKAFVKVQRKQEKILPPTPLSQLTTPNTSEETSMKKCQKVLKCIKNYDLSNFEAHLQGTSNKNQNNFFEVSSLQRGIFLEVKKQSTLETKDQVQEEKFENIDIKKTIASIKQVYPQKFYIGSKDDYGKKKSKKQSYISVKNLFNNRMKSRLNWQEAQNKESSVSQGKVQRINKPKPISAKHPFKRNQNIYQDSYKYEEKSTRIHEEQQQEEQTGQFIDDAVPGPGTYEINRIIQTTKKCPLYTEKNKARFQQKNNEVNLAQQLIYHYQHNHRKSKSRASQRKVGFGRSLTHKSTTNATEMMQKTEQAPLFYENNKSIQNNSIRMKLKDALNPGFFSSKVQRFPQTEKKLVFNGYQDELTQQEHLKRMKRQFCDHKLTHPFNSTVSREKLTPPLTADIEYSGQDYKTIQNNLKNLLCQPQYFFQDDPQQLDFQTEIQKTQHRNPPPLKHAKSQIQIKHHLIENIYGFRQRDKKLSKKQIKAYTFNTKQTVQPGNKQNSPDPTKYHTQLKWVKNNFSMRFQQRINKKAQPRLFQEILEEEPKQFLDDALHIVKI